MTLFDRFLATLDRVSSPSSAHAHCDVPCGIYDPYAAQIAALTVLRMNQLAEGLQGGPGDLAYQNSMTRYVKAKEDHAEIVKHEVAVIWHDYIRPEFLEKYPDLHDRVFKLEKLAGQNKQQMNKDLAEQLLTGVQDFAALFWETKGVATRRVPSNQAVGGELVVPA
jgi:nickel superoxide dismutase